MLEQTETDSNEREHEIQTEVMPVCELDTPSSKSDTDEMRYAWFRSVVRRRVEE